MPSRELREIIRLADRLHAAQMAYLFNNSLNNSDALRKATHEYTRARHAMILPAKEAQEVPPVTLEEITNAVLVRCTGLDLKRPLSKQEVDLAMAVIGFTYEEMVARSEEERGDER